MPKNKIYAIVDLETTGGMAKRDKITEIGIVLWDGDQILDQYTTLVNPCRSIPPEITRITGITDEMVADAPQFYEVAKKVVQLTEGTIFVAHNVRFDYGFLKAEFASLGYTYTRKTLDTVRLSRHAFPGLRSYSLGNLIRHFGIEVNARHRALDDALATTDVLSRVFNQDYGYEKSQQLIDAHIKSSKLPAAIDRDKIMKLPEEAGVYYFYNAHGKIIYIGKSINIRKRILQHFSKVNTKAEKLSQAATDISYELTGNELIAMLLESHEIKAYQPEINKAQRNRLYRYFIHYYYDRYGYVCFEIQKSNKKNRAHKHILASYSSKPGALSDLNHAVEALELCSTKMGISTDDHPCFNYKIEKCHGACIQKEDPIIYNQRAELAIELMKKMFDDNFVLVLDGRTSEEKSVILIENGNYRGYGYMLEEDLNLGIEEIKESINYVPENPEANGIIKTYLRQHPFTKRITF